MRKGLFGVSLVVALFAASMWSAPFDAQAPAAGAQPGARGGRDGAAGDQGGG